MSALHEVTVAELKAHLTKEEVEALPEAVTDGSADDWLAELLLQACNRVVGALNACERNTPIRAGLCKVPAECVRVVLALARHSVIAAMPGNPLAGALEGSARAAEYQSALADLSALASCELLPAYSLEEGEEAQGLGGGISIRARQGFNWLM